MMAIVLVMATPIVAHAQIYPGTPDRTTGMTMMSPTYPVGPGAVLPFPSQQRQQQRMLDMLQPGGTERLHRLGRQAQLSPGCIYSGQLYTEGAVVKTESGRQVCVERDDAGQGGIAPLPLTWRGVAGG